MAAKTPYCKTIQHIVTATTREDLGLLHDMPPLEVMTKLNTIKTAWVRKVLSKPDVTRRQSRSGHGKKFIRAQLEAGHLKENWAQLEKYALH